MSSPVSSSQEESDEPLLGGLLGATGTTGAELVTLHDRVYGGQRRHDLARQAVYGLAERARAELRGARLDANPGCYATCAALPLVPLARAGLLTDLVVIDGKSGVSGAGRSPTPSTHFSVEETIVLPGAHHDAVRWVLDAVEADPSSSALDATPSMSREAS